MSTDKEERKLCIGVRYVGKSNNISYTKNQWLPIGKAVIDNTFECDGYVWTIIKVINQSI